LRGSRMISHPANDFSMILRGSRMISHNNITGDHKGRTLPNAMVVRVDRLWEGATFMVARCPPPIGRTPLSLD
jgi:hypothetical protein